MAGPGSWRYNAAVRRARLISLLLLVAVPTQARGREKILLLDRSPLKMDRRIRQQVMDGLQTALESGGFLVQRRSPTTPDRAPIEELLTEDPENPVFNAHYASLLAEQRRHAEAIPYARRALEAGFRTADDVCNLAMCLLFTEQVPEAKRTFEEALELNAKHLLSLYWVA